MSQLSTVSTPVTSNSNKTPTPSRRGSRESTSTRESTTPTQTRKESVKSSRRGSSVSGCQTPTPRQRSFAAKDSEEQNGSLVNGGASEEEEIKHKVNGNSSPLKTSLAADGSNNNDIDSIPCVWCPPDLASQTAKLTEKPQNGETKFQRNSRLRPITDISNVLLVRSKKSGDCEKKYRPKSEPCYSEIISMRKRVTFSSSLSSNASQKVGFISLPQDCVFDTTSFSLTNIRIWYRYIQLVRLPPQLVTISHASSRKLQHLAISHINTVIVNHFIMMLNRAHSHVIYSSDLLDK